MKKEIKLNIGCGIDLKAGYINVDKYIDYEELKKGAKTKEGIYSKSKIGKGAKFIKGDILELPFPDNYADYILCVDVIEHIKMRDVVLALKELRRVLKSTGELCLATFDFDNLAKQWVALSEQEFDSNKFLNLAQHIYGNQAGSEDGEIHKCPFNPGFMNIVMQMAGWDNYTMTKHFQGTRHPLLKGYGKEVTKGYLLGDMLVVKAKKGSKKIKSIKKK